ncbi:MAG: sulfotransferase [Gammaproteobacteria bacterium]
MSKTTLLYISAYQYSGSTLTSFLLNTHPEITSLGHTAGWPFDKDEAFYCSCGAVIQDCSFYQHLAKTFKEHNLPFEFHDFGAAFKVTKNSRLNRYLTASMPLLESSALEHLRDAVIGHLPVTGARLARQRKANDRLIATAVEYHNSSIYLDNSLDPYRLRHLKRIDSLAVKNIHLVRNPRGVAASCLRHRGWSPEQTLSLWLRHQRDIVRIASDVDDSITVHYDDLCTNTDEELARLHAYAGVEPRTFAGDFKDAEHHILGNQMRLGDGKIKLDTRWQKELTSSQLSGLNKQLQFFLDTPKYAQYKPLLGRYLDDKS